MSRRGIRLFVQGREFFLPHKDFPWFEGAKVKDILNVREEGETHPPWPTLDVDLNLDVLEHPEHYPFVAKHCCSSEGHSRGALTTLLA